MWFILLVVTTRFPRRALLRYATIFYCLMGAVAYVWAWFTDGPLIYGIQFRTQAELLTYVIIGLSFALFLHLLTRFMTGRVSWSDALMDWFQSELGHITTFDALWLALLSGFAEELLFRGAIQASWGLIPATVLFGIIHWPPDKRLRAWTWMAGVVGLFLGLSVEWTGSIVPAISAHVGINFLNLSYIAGRAKISPDMTRTRD